MEKRDDYTKVTEEVDAEQGNLERKKPQMSATRARKVTIFLSLDLWMVILVFLLYNIHVNTFERIGANLNSVQFLVGDGTMTTFDIEKSMLTRLEEINAEMDEARERLSEAMEELAKYDEEIQDIILNKIDVISGKVEWIIESTGNLQDFIQEAKAKTMGLIISFSFFLTYIMVTWFGLIKISKLFTNQFLIFVVTMLGHILMFIFIIGLYTFVFTDVLERIHPDSVLLAL